MVSKINEHTTTVNIRMKHLKTGLMLLLISKREKTKIELLKERKQTVVACFQFSATSN